MKTLSMLFFLTIIIAGCKDPGDRASQQQAADEGGQRKEGVKEQQYEDTTTYTKAVAVLQPAGDNKVKGQITFTKAENGVKLVAEITGLKPGKHGFHVHEFGDCSSPDFNTAGAHFNPMKHEHGDPTSQNRHAGDLGNIEADANGTARFEWVDQSLTFYGPNSIIGRSVVVHENPDDMTTQPSGNAGGRIACGVIGISK